MFHDLAKGAFDAVTVRDPNRPAKINTDLFNQPLEALSQGLRDKATTIVPDMMQYLGTALGAAGGVGTGLALGTEGALTAGPVGAVLGFAVEEGIKWAFKFAPDKLSAYGEGQWVIMDFGMKPEKHYVAEDPFFEDLAFEIRKPDLQVGFFIDVASKVGFITCWHFRKGHPVDVDTSKVQAVPQEQAREYDRNEQMSVIRELFFAESLGLSLNADIPTDPGSEVIYEDAVYQLVSSANTTAIISDGNGTQKHVNLADLKRGRVASNRSWHYRKEPSAWSFSEVAGRFLDRLDPSTYTNQTPGIASFAAQGEGQIVYQGQWVWAVPTKAVLDLFPHKKELINKVLCCVSHLDGDKVVVYQAIDGERRVLKEVVIVPVQEELLTTFEKKRQFAAFRDAAVRSMEVDAVRLGSDFLALCVGLTTTGEDARRIDFRRFVPVSAISGGSATPRVDAALKAAAPTPGDRGRAQQNDAREEVLATSGGAAPPPVTAGALRGPSDTPGGKENNSMMYIIGGCAAVGAAIYFLG